MSIIFVGEVTNPPGLDPRYALTGKSGEHLAELAGLSKLALYRYRRFNVDETGVSDKATRRENAHDIEVQAQKGDAIVMLGREVIDAFGFGALPFFTRATNARGVILVGYPHPSPANRYWNDKRSTEEARLYLRSIISEFGDKGDTSDDDL